MSRLIEIPVKTQKVLQQWPSIVPKLTNGRHKGQYGRIGVIGGSLEYSGAPYFAAISALKVGADLAHVFCPKDAAPIIKSYSPDLIVHPLLDAADAFEQIQPWLDRLHVMVIGPGLGREKCIFDTVARLMEVCRTTNKPMIIDADGLALLGDRMDLVSSDQNTILTPNAIEYKRLFGDNIDEVKEKMSQLGEGVIVLEKSAQDRVHIPQTHEVYILPPGGSGRRCGGQGDLLSGSLATFFHWALSAKKSNAGFLACCAASQLVKECNAIGFERHGRSLLASDMVTELAPAFKKMFETA